jgi:predicted methyltransferase
VKALSPQQRAALAVLLNFSRRIGYYEWRVLIHPFRQSTRKRLEDDGLIVIEDGTVRITDKGRRVLEQ